eukprot:403361573
MLRTPGTLFIRCISAKLTHDTETFGRMDPYVKITIGATTLKTKTHNSAGKTPRWEETLKFKLSGSEEEIKIAVWDEDMTNDDLVGDTVYFLDEIKSKGKFQEAVKLAYKGKEAGIVNIEFEFFSEAIQTSTHFMHQAPIHTQGMINPLPQGMLGQPIYNQMQMGFQQNILPQMNLPMGMPPGSVPPFQQPPNQFGGVPQGYQPPIGSIPMQGGQVPVYNQMQQHFPQYMQQNYNQQMPGQYLPPQPQQYVNQLHQQQLGQPAQLNPGMPPLLQQQQQQPPIAMGQPIQQNQMPQSKDISQQQPQSQQLPKQDLYHYGYFDPTQSQ